MNKRNTAAPDEASRLQPRPEETLFYPAGPQSCSSVCGVVAFWFYLCSNKAASGAASSVANC